MLQKATASTFDEEVLAASGPVVVDFWAAWCPPCRASEPVVTELAEAYPGTTFRKVDIDAHPEIASRFGVLAFPTLLVFEGGEERARLVGARPRRRLEGDLAPWLLAASA